MNTQEKQEINTKIEELKKTIAELEAKVNEPEEQQTWEPHGKYFIAINGCTDKIGVNLTGYNSFISEQAAQYAADKLKPIYKLLSYVTEFDKEEYGDKNFLVCKGKLDNVWICYDLISGDYCPDSILISKRCAEELVDKLNKGLVKLD